MKKLILIRHGESEWNKLNLFTGWTNVDLSEKGVQEAIEAEMPKVEVAPSETPSESVAEEEIQEKQSKRHRPRNTNNNN